MDFATITPLAQVSRQRRWRAAWIWDDSDNQRDNQYRLFRRVIDLSAVDPAVELLVTAGQQYRVWINGSFLGDGPPQSATHHQYFDRYPIAGLLRAGVNCIAVQVRTLGRRAPACGGLLCEVVAGETAVVASDASWRVWAGSAWKEAPRLCAMNQMAPYQEHCDGRRLPWGWQMADFDDGTWSPAQELGRPPLVRPWIALAERDIPHLERQVVRPVSISAEEAIDLPHHHDSEDASLNVSMPGRALRRTTVEGLDQLRRGEDGCRLACSTDHLREPFCDGRWGPCLLFDFGEQVTACVELVVSAEAGAILELGYAECLIDGYFNSTLPCHFADAYTCRDGHQTFRFAVWRGFRYLRLRLRGSDAPLFLHALRCIRYRAPLAERGSLQADEELERVLDVSRKTIRICAVDALMDTPWREAGQWLGDVAAVTCGGLYACFGDTDLAGKFYRQAAGNQLHHGLISNLTNCDPMVWNPIPDFSLHYIRGLWRHYRYTGAVSWIHAFYPVCRRIIDWFLRYLNDDGLLEDIPCWVVIDWAAVDKGGCNLILNSLLAGALEDFRAMAVLLGDADSARWSGDLLAHLRATIPQRFADDDGLLHDAIRDGQLSPIISEHGHAAAIVGGCLSADRATALISRLWERREVPAVVECQPYFSIVLFEALTAHRRQDLALTLIRERWAGRLLANGHVSWPEKWTVTGGTGGGRWTGNLSSHSHAWSATPAEFLLRMLPGISILEAGCSRLAIDPYTGLDYSVTYPLPQGDLIVTVAAGSVSWQAPAGVVVVR